MTNPNVAVTLEDAVAEVLGLLTGLDLSYIPETDRFQAVVRALNRAVRQNALESEWSFYTSTESIGLAVPGVQDIPIRASLRPRIIRDDSVKFVTPDGTPVVWAYYLPRDAIDKYPDRTKLYVSSTRQSLHFSRPFSEQMRGLEILVPAMREPNLFIMPPLVPDAYTPTAPVPEATLEQLIDFDYPDLIIARAAWLYAQTDPVMQPRVQTLEAQYKDLMYSLIERDNRNTDSPYLNDFILPIEGNINGDRPYSNRPYSTDWRG